MFVLIEMCHVNWFHLEICRFSHYAKSQTFVQKIDFDKPTLNFYIFKIQPTLKVIFGDFVIELLILTENEFTDNIWTFGIVCLCGN